MSGENNDSTVGRRTSEACNRCYAGFEARDWPRGATGRPWGSEWSKVQEAQEATKCLTNAEFELLEEWLRFQQWPIRPSHRQTGRGGEP